MFGFWRWTTLRSIRFRPLASIRSRLQGAHPRRWQSDMFQGLQRFCHVQTLLSRSDCGHSQNKDLCWDIDDSSYWCYWSWLDPATQLSRSKWSELLHHCLWSCHSLASYHWIHRIASRECPAPGLTFVALTSIGRLSEELPTPCPSGDSWISSLGCTREPAVQSTPVWCSSCPLLLQSLISIWPCSWLSIETSLGENFCYFIHLQAFIFLLPFLSHYCFLSLTVT